MPKEIPHDPTMFTVRPIARDSDGRVSRADFDWVYPWWEARGGESPTREMLPGCGAIAEWNGEPVACAFLYLDATGSGVAWLAWVATKPGTPGKRVVRAFRALFQFLTDFARSMNYWLVNATYHHPSLVSLLKGQGFHVGDVGMVQLFKTLH
jgi:hypothetical protein